MRLCAWVASLVFAGIVAGCGAPAGQLQMPSPEVVARLTEPASIAADFPTSTPQPEIIYASAGSQPVNCRFGPGVIYEIIGSLDAEQSTRVAGRDYTGSWVYIHDPLNPGGFCWVSRDFVNVDGVYDALPVFDPPYVTVKKMIVYVEPQRVTVSCDNFPQYALFVGEITTNGPTVVNWRWELSTGEVTDAQTLTFEEAGTKTLQKSFVIYKPNDYWVRLHVNAPNETAYQANFVANCTP